MDPTVIQIQAGALCKYEQPILLHGYPQASQAGELQQLESELQRRKGAEEQLNSRLAEAEAGRQQQEEASRQAERQLSQMVESQRRSSQELQEGVEAREDAEAARDQAQVLTPSTFAQLGSFASRDRCIPVSMLSQVAYLPAMCSRCKNFPMCDSDITKQLLIILGLHRLQAVCSMDADQYACASFPLPCAEAPLAAAIHASAPLQQVSFFFFFSLFFFAFCCQSASSPLLVCTDPRNVVVTSRRTSFFTRHASSLEFI